MNIKVYSQDGKSIGEENLSDKVFAEKKNDTLVYLALKKYMSAQRQGTHSTLTRTEVSGGGKKPWKQKGTGRARAGSTRSPLWRHGGVVFGPKPRDYDTGLPKKAAKKAVRVLLSDKARDGKLIVLDSLKIAKPKTSEMVKVLKALKIDGTKTLLVIKPFDKNVALSARNIENMAVRENINVYDLMIADNVVVSREAAKKFEEVL
ncbi:MAG TPA: 50S ribosomal protein L4 [Candidatus Omnitrophota bacterium]|nr:50S ribosomal protein L4 [Candidatus Omnitrophota bacterium]